MSQLPVPTAVSESPNSVEVLRVWVAKGDQHVSLSVDVWNDPAAWGLLLADLARHVSRAYAQAHGRDAAAALARIREGFDAEWSSPTDAPSGGLKR